MKHIARAGWIAGCSWILLRLFSCIGDSAFTTPTLDCAAGVQANGTFEKWIESPRDRNGGGDTDWVFPAYVISSDAAGNFYKTLCLQAAPSNPKCEGIEVHVDGFDTYLDYPVGTKLLVQARGLHLSRKNGGFQLGYPCGAPHCPSGVGRIDANALAKYLHFSCDSTARIRPKVYRSIQEAKADAKLNTLVRIEGVAFAAGDTAKCYADKEKDGNRSLIDRAGEQLIVHSSRYAAFAALNLPDGSGSITGVMGKYGGDFALRIRDRSDVHLDELRFKKSRAAFPCASEYDGSFTNLCYLHRLYSGQEKRLRNRKIKVVVTSDNRGGNINVTDAAVQDQTAGIHLHFVHVPIIFPQDQYRPLKPGDWLEVGLAGAVLTGSAGPLQINASRNQVQYLDTKAVKPKIITVKQLNTNRYESMLVQLNDVTYAEPGFPFYSGEAEEMSHILSDATGTTRVQVSDGIAFASVIVPRGKVSVVGNAGNDRGTAQLLPRNEADVRHKAKEK